MAAGQLTPTDGRLAVPSGPGLGVDVVEEALEALTVWTSVVR